MLIDFTITRQIVEKFLMDNFTECPIQYENIPLPEDNPKEYIAVFDKVNTNFHDTLQSTSSPCKGVIIIQIFTQLGTGTQRAREIGSLLSSLLGAKSIDSIAFQNGSLFGVPTSPKDVYYQHSINFEYTFIYGQNNVCEG